MQFACAAAFGLFCTAEAVRAEDAMGPLSVCPGNPRYFCEPSGNAVFLAGAHTWNNLVDMGAKHPPPEFVFEAYLDFLESHHHNTIRLWTWETAKPEDWFDTPLRGVATPLVWARSGPGLANDGLPRFDLERFNAEYFSRLKQRVAKARARGFYVIVVLFEGWSVQLSPGRNTHPFHPDNNINDTSFLNDVEEIHSLKHPEILAIQERYVEEVIDTLAGMDNLLFEIVNEAGGYSTEWQYHMIEFVRSRLDAHGYRAPVGMSFQHRNGDNAALFASPADWIAPGAHPGFYRTNPAVARGAKVIIADTDHLAGSSLVDPVWPYKALLRGLNVLYMDRYFGSSSVSTEHVNAAPAIRANIGTARLLADLLQIREAVPKTNVSSSRYALVADDWMLVLAPDAQRLEVDLRDYAGQMGAVWIDILRKRLITADAVETGDFSGFYPPVRGGALLYLRRARSAAPRLESIGPDISATAAASVQYTDIQTRLRSMVSPWLSLIGRNYSNLAVTLIATGLLGLLAGISVAYVVLRSRWRR
ncbi:DUF6298 domain-containing protein [Lentisalinibacter salinarum]|uniref:DUF6298 domain-containing protein n=1 Tax=Lentisalinibacter salinarum TaxID=2992239 RepID=UPI003868043E